MSVLNLSYSLISCLCTALLSTLSIARDSAFLREGESGQVARSILGYDRTALAPYLWNMRGMVPLDSQSLQRIYEEKDPLQIFHAAFRLMDEYHRTGDKRALDQAIAGVDFMLESYEPRQKFGAGIRWFYGHDFESIKAPWWSGMDALFGPLVLYAAYEITGETHYRDIALASARLAIRTPLEGGVVWQDKGECWISEYAWTGMSFNDELFVLNGHMWGLQALYMLSESSGDDELREAYACALEGTRKRANRFLTKDGDWTWYQLNPLVINPVHYNLLEMAQFRAMGAMTNDNLYKEMEAQRVAVFKGAYPVELFENGKQISVIFSLVGPPHPYWTDTYPVTLECHGQGEPAKFVQSRHYSSDPRDERFFAVVDIDTDPASCSISVRSGVDVPVYDEEALSVNKDSEEKVEIDPTPAVSLDARAFSGDHASIVPSYEEIPDENNYMNSEARLKFNIPLSYSEKDMLAFVLSPEVDLKMAFLMENDKGQQSSRYYPSLRKDKDNIVLLHRLGFEGSDEMSGLPSHLTARLFTTGLQSPFSVRVVDYSLIKNSKDLKAFFARHGDAYFFQKNSAK